MGGGAFASASAIGEPTLNTPRMSPNHYAYLKAVYLKKLRDCFPGSEVACLTEAPEKTDYGDLDIFVAVDQRVNFVDVASSLGAAGVIYHTSGTVQKCSLAVPFDGSAHSRPVTVYKHINGDASRKLPPSTVVTVDDYAQIDVEIISPEILEWHRFYSSYGDLAGLLGHTVHNLGFTVFDRGLKLRLPELDWSKQVDHVNIGDKEASILLSGDPKAVMEFLGLSVPEYNAGFATVDELYEWLGSCRLISPHAIKWKRNNAHERRREDTRTMFTRFFNEWLPEHMKTDQEQNSDISEEQQTAMSIAIMRELRLKYLEEAVDYFNKRMEYEKMHNAIVLVVKNATVTELLKPILGECSGKEGKSLNEIVRAFRRYVGFGSDGNPYVLDKPHTDVESQLHHFLAEDGESLRDLNGTREWVDKHWEELKGLERQRITAVIEKIDHAHS